MPGTEAATASAGQELKVCGRQPDDKRSGRILRRGGSQEEQFSPPGKERAASGRRWGQSRGRKDRRCDKCWGLGRGASKAASAQSPPHQMPLFLHPLHVAICFRGFALAPQHCFLGSHHFQEPALRFCAQSHISASLPAPASAITSRETLFLHLLLPLRGRLT